ncbi:MAG: beta-ketoacyl-[acyl-carrier-protein] synthase family protein [Chitinophagales bacterium]
MSVKITGIGIISAIGNNAEETLNSLKTKKSGISNISILENHEADLAGEIKYTNQELKSLLKIKDKYVSRTSLLAAFAAKEALGNIQQTKNDGFHYGIISSSSVGGMDQSENYFKAIFQEKASDIQLLKTHDLGDGTEFVAKYLGINGFASTISTACSSGVNAIMLGARMIEQGMIDRVLVGGTDALSDFTINGFKSLKIYDEAWCRPMDDSRVGLNLGEAAGYLLLESDRSIEASGNKILAEVVGYANANDAYHQTASSPDGNGATLAIKEAIKVAAIKPEEISYINVHGTGTKNNDLSESIALQNVFGENIPPFSSTKAFTGHTLAAAGAIESVFSVLALQNQVLLANINFKKPLAETNLTPVTDYIENAKVDYILSNSFGFGGNNSAIIFKKA